MADYLNNVAAGDAYTQACSLGPNFDAKYAVITIANAAALMQFAIGRIGNYRWTDEREYQSIPQSFRVGNVIGFRARNAVPGVAARVLAVLAGDDDPDFQSGVPFNGILSAAGGVTPGAGTVEIDHNGAAVSTQPKVDFEDAGSFQWTVVDDPANTRAKITPPQFVSGLVSAAGAAIGGSGFTCARTGVGAYTINFNTPFAAIPNFLAMAIENTSPNVSIVLNGRAVGQVTIQIYTANTGVARDTAFSFLAVPMP